MKEANKALNYLNDLSRKMDQGEISSIQSDAVRLDQEKEISEDIKYCIELLTPEIEALNALLYTVKKLHNLNGRYAIEFKNETLYFISRDAYLNIKKVKDNG